MGRLKIHKIIYTGDNYYYESPDLNDGINIIEGENEHGKSTFMNLIYYGLGGKVPGFDKLSKEIHSEICNDSNNSVTLAIAINNDTYELIRNIGDNHIYVVSSNGDITETVIYRNKEDLVFSDWILDKLEVSVFDIFQGTKSYKIGFSDLMRLLYHDQKTEIDKIYKAPENDNFITDALEIRKAIFEVLMGQAYDEYYKLLGQYKAKRKEYDEVNAIMSSYDEFLSDVLDDYLEHAESIKERIEEAEGMIEKIEIEKERVKNASLDVDEVLRLVEFEKKALLDKEIEKDNLSRVIVDVKVSVDKLLFLIEQLEREIEEVKRIRFLNNKLKFFSPNTCPYCLSEVERKEGECICGNALDEEEYEKFFYSDSEYIEIIQVKNKSLKTLKEILNKKIKRIENLEHETVRISKNITLSKNQISELIEDISPDYNSAVVRALDVKLFNLKSNLIDYEKALVLANKKEKIVMKLTEVRNQLEGLSNKTDIALSKARDDIHLKRIAFNEHYLAFMKKADKNCHDAYISEDYMPYINSGVYRARSTSVPKRLMYFLTLLKMSVIGNTSHPHFLLIDTPNKEGIDRENLERNIATLELFSKNEESVEDYQVIISTGLQTYPTEFSKFVFQTLKDENKLLIKK